MSERRTLRYRCIHQGVLFTIYMKTYFIIRHVSFKYDYDDLWRVCIWHHWHVQLRLYYCYGLTAKRKDLASFRTPRWAGNVRWGHHLQTQDLSSSRRWKRCAYPTSSIRLSLIHKMYCDAMRNARQKEILVKCQLRGNWTDCCQRREIPNTYILLKHVHIIPYYSHITPP